MAKPNVTTTISPESTDSDHPYRYTAQLADQIELRWQQVWEENQTFATPNPGAAGFDATKPKYYCLDMFPYPSGAGLHVGHPEGYTATDIICRFRRLQGFNVLHPMGWDAYGLPAEQYAIQTGVHPAKTTRTAIDNFRRQLKRFGFCYDWNREFATIDQDYYRWTQWIWLQAYNCWYDTNEQRARPISDLAVALGEGAVSINADNEIIHAPGPGETTTRWSDLSDQEQRHLLDQQRLAYLAEQTVNWCPKLGTVLANEEVTDGRSERGEHPVHRMPLRQWMFRITAYADRLLGDLGKVSWPESTRTMQAAWIGRSEGAEIDFAVVDGAALSCPEIRVYTTRPDTVFGATFMVLAPEHPLIDAVIERDQAGTTTLQEYVRAARDRSDIDRMSTTREKTGVDTGVRATNPATGEEVPVWVADYVLMGYGHGAIMAVPAHDDRDFEFAQTFGLTIRDVVYSPALAAVHAFCMHVNLADAEDNDAAVKMLIDFVGLAVNQTRHDYEDIYRTISGRRDIPTGIEEDTITTGEEVQDAAEELTDEGSATGATGDRRGSIVTIWEDSLGDLLKNDISSLIADAKAGYLSVRLGAATSEPGCAVNSANDDVSLNGLATAEAKATTIDWLERSGTGRRQVNFKLRDWLFSRQRYWGEPFPVVFDRRGDHFAIGESHLPVALPELEDFKPVESNTPSPLLAKAESWVNTTAGEAGVQGLSGDVPVRRETNTMPGWAGSCWYYLRYCDPKNNERFVSRDAERYWMLSRKDGGACATNESYDPAVHHSGGVDLYVGGAEHAVLHLLYARFWHKLLFDLGHVSTPEPFGKLFHQGMISSHAYQRSNRTLVAVDEVNEQDDGTFIETATGEAVTQVVAKMSKSLKNVVNPDDIIAEYGADTFRLYEMYMGPLDAAKPWNTRDIIGPFRFLQRLWRVAVDEATGELRLATQANDAVERLLHRTIDKVQGDIDRLAFNTAIAAMIQLINEATNHGGFTRDQLERFTIMLSPFAPHMAEELWAKLGHDSVVANATWPTVDEAMLKDDTIELPVQIKGKVRGRITVAADASQDAVEEIALADERIIEALDGQSVKKVIVVPGRIVNIIPG